MERLKSLLFFPKDLDAQQRRNEAEEPLVISVKVYREKYFIHIFICDKQSSRQIREQKARLAKQSENGSFGKTLSFCSKISTPGAKKNQMEFCPLTQPSFLCESQHLMSMD